MLRTVVKLVLLSVTVPFTVLLLSVAFIYTGIIRRGIWMLVNLFIGTICSVLLCLPANQAKSFGRMHAGALLVVALMTFGIVFYQKSVPLPYTHYLQYLNSIEYQVLGYDDLTDNSGAYTVLNQPRSALYEKNFESGMASTVLPFWELGKSEVKRHHVEKTDYFFFVDPLKWASSLMLLPKFVYVVMLLYAVWLTVFSRVFDVFLYRWILR